MAASPLSRVRKICLALPEATEKVAWGEPTWRVRDKLFAMFANNHHGDGRIALWCKAAPGAAGGPGRREPEALLRAALRRQGRLDRHPTSTRGSTGESWPAS